MSDQQPAHNPPVPPYASNPTQPQYPGTPAPPPAAAPAPAPQTQAPAQPSYAPQTQTPAQPSYAQQTPAQPSYQQHATPVYGQPTHASATAPADAPGATNGPGRLAFILGLVSVGLQVLMSVIIQILVRSVGYPVVGAFSGVFGVLIFLCGVGALVFGIIGLKRTGSPQALAGIGTGLGIAVTVSAGVSFIINALSALIYF